MRCPIPEDIQLLDVMPHTHLTGTRFEAWITDPVSGERSPFLTSAGYGDLEPRRLAEPIGVRAG